MMNRLIVSIIRYAQFPARKTALVLSLGERGATVIEFAIVIPIFVLLFMGVVEFSLIMYVSGVLDGATVTAARAGKTGFPLDGDRAAYVKGVLEGRTSGIMDSNRLILASRAYNGYAGVTTLAPCLVDDAACPHELGTASSIVVYTSSYQWNVITPGLAAIIGDEDGNFVVRSTALVKNEPWN